MDALALALTTQSRILFGIGRTPRSDYFCQRSNPDSRRRDWEPIHNAGPDCRRRGCVSSARRRIRRARRFKHRRLPRRTARVSKSYDLYERALAIDPTFGEAKREIATNHMSIGSIFMLKDPARAINEFRKSLSLWSAMPSTDRSDNNTRRTILYDTIGLAAALTQTRDYDLAISTYEEAQKSIEVSAALDRKIPVLKKISQGYLGGKPIPI